MSEDPWPYIAYLLRLWLAPGPGPPLWRASLEDPHTGNRQGFGSLDDLVAYLRVLTGDRNREADRKKGGEDQQ